MSVSGPLIVNGVISSNGANGCGAGSGGSIWIEAQNITGIGSITANGGDTGSTTCGSGGGGRIAIYTSNMTAYSGAISAAGGNAGTVNTGCQGTAGTIFTSVASVSTLLADNLNRVSKWTTTLTDAFDAFDNLFLENNAVLTVVAPTSSTNALTIGTTLGSNSKKGKYKDLRNENN